MRINLYAIIHVETRGLLERQLLYTHFTSRFFEAAASLSVQTQEGHNRIIQERASFGVSTFDVRSYDWVQGGQEMTKKNEVCGCIRGPHAEGFMENAEGTGGTAYCNVYCYLAWQWRGHSRNTAEL